MALIVNTNIKNDTDQYLLDAKNVKGGYVVVQTLEERNNLPSATIVEGSLCYCVQEDKFYRFNGTEWEDAVYTKESIDTMLQSKQEKLTAGFGIAISETGTISINLESAEGNKF